MNWSEFGDPIVRSIQVATFASMFVMLIGIAAAWWITHTHFRGKSIIETVFMLPLVLPPTVVGFLLLVIFGRHGWFGELLRWLLNVNVLFTWWAAVVASVIVAFPLVYQTMKTGFRSVDRECEDAARSSGANEWQVFRYISLPLCSRSLLTAFILGFARGLGEFGATLMLAGNIPGKTQTIPTAIYVAVNLGDNVLAWAWTSSAIAISFILLWFTNRQEKEINKN